LKRNVASAFGSLSDRGVQAIVDRLAEAGLDFALTERILAFGSSSTSSGKSSNTRAIRGHRFLKRSVVAATMLLAMSKETLVAEGLGFGPIRAALVGSPIDWKPFHATLLGHDTKAIPRITLIQMVAKKDYLIAYFLDQVPHDLNISTMPKTTRDIIVARVNLIERPVYLVGRDQSGRPSAPPKSPFRSRLKILEVFSGSAIVGETFDVTFGSFNSSGKRHFRPYTPSQVSRDYVVVIYTGDDDQRHLAGFPIDEAQYLKWESEVRGVEEPQGKPRNPQ
jgi:hypothetical protein